MVSLKPGDAVLTKLHTSVPQWPLTDAFAQALSTVKGAESFIMQRREPHLVRSPRLFSNQENKSLWIDFENRTNHHSAHMLIWKIKTGYNLEMDRSSLFLIVTPKGAGNIPWTHAKRCDLGKLQKVGSRLAPGLWRDLQFVLNTKVRSPRCWTKLFQSLQAQPSSLWCDTG